jgi:hypothetical protein
MQVQDVSSPTIPKQPFPSFDFIDAGGFEFVFQDVHEELAVSRLAVAYQWWFSVQTSSESTNVEGNE